MILNLAVDVKRKRNETQAVRWVSQIISSFSIFHSIVTRNNRKQIVSHWDQSSFVTVILMFIVIQNILRYVEMKGQNWRTRNMNPSMIKISLNYAKAFTRFVTTSLVRCSIEILLRTRGNKFSVVGRALQRFKFKFSREQRVQTTSAIYRSLVKTQA